MSADRSLVVLAVPGLPEFAAGDDLAAVLLPPLRIRAALAGRVPGLRAGDVVAVTSKVVSKAEGRRLAAEDREAAIDAEAVAEVARRVHADGSTRIVRTRHGLVLAAAGVDASNTEPGTVLLLRWIRTPRLPGCGRGSESCAPFRCGRDHYRHRRAPVARGRHRHLHRSSRVRVLDDLRGRRDRQGNALSATVVAVADELAAAAELVRPKTAGLPVAVLRGDPAAASASGQTAADLVRPAAADLFRLGTAEAAQRGAASAAAARRTVREFAPDRPVPRELLDAGLAAAITAPARTTRPRGGSSSCVRRPGRRCWTRCAPDGSRTCATSTVSTTPRSPVGSPAAMCCAGRRRSSWRSRI